MDRREIDMLNRDEIAKHVPHEWYDWLRNNDPVFLNPETNGPGFYVLSRHADVVKAASDPFTFSSAAKYGGVVALEDHEPLSRAQPPSMGEEQLIINTMDPPIHQKYRKLVSAPFTPRRLRELEDHVRNLCIRILEDAIAKGTCDWTVDVASEMPITVICEFLGVPLEDRHKILDWSNRLNGTEDEEFMYDSAPDEYAMERAMVAIFEYAQGLATERRKAPRDDVVSMLVNGTVDDEPLTDAEFEQFFMAMATGGNESTRYTLANSMLAFVNNPDQYKALVADPGLIPTAVEEMLRWSTPLIYFRRTVVKDTEIGGKQLKVGDKVMLNFLAANYDDTVFENPKQFNIYRKPNPHVTFGGGGPHVCLGGSLARMQLRVMMEELVKRMPEPKMVGESERLRSIFVNGTKHLWLDMSNCKSIAPKVPEPA